MKCSKNLFLALLGLALAAIAIALPVKYDVTFEPYDEENFNEIALKAYNEMVPFEGMYDTLMLPEGFENKPTELQDEASIELRKQIPNASIPIIDPGKDIGFRFSPSLKAMAKSGMPDTKEWTVCETSPGFPSWQGIYLNFEYLQSIKNNWCCVDKPSPNGCQLLHPTFYDATDICATMHSCVRCGWAALAIMDIMITCHKESKAGDYKRRVIKWESGAESKVEVNVYKMKTFFHKN
ncbi:hypothetical protein FPV67DRAFT_1461973 [Lyophyllum atratum]|nr:hypothetical protein FPV67DRAFT_1461973 [Lyophyllum atratum]